MNIKISESIDKIKSYYKKNYKDELNYINSSEYQFVMLLIEKMPYLEMSKDFPEFALDNCELICEVIANFNINDSQKVEDLTTFIKTLSENKEFKRYTYDFFFFLDIYFNSTDEYEQLKLNLKDLYTEYCIDYYKQ